MENHPGETGNGTLLSGYCILYFLSNFVIFHQIKVAKHIWETCCHLAAETGSCSPFINKNIFQ